MNNYIKKSKIHLIFGRQGAGKSTYSKTLAKEVNGIHLSIDDWMVKLFGQDLPKSMNIKWIFERVERCEKKIWEITKDVSNCGCSVILDLGFIKYSKRKEIMGLIEQLGREYQIHYITAPYEIRKNRVLQRNIEKGDTFSFEVTSGMFDFMEKEFQSLADKELENAIVIETK